MVKRPVEPGVERPADVLRRNLLEAEQEAAWLLRGKGELIPLLHRLDAVAEGLEALEAEGTDLRPERARWESLGTQMRRGVEKLFKHAQEGTNAIHAARDRAQPPREHWWWYLDELARQHRRQRAGHVVRTSAIIAVVLAVAGALAYFFLRPDPLTAEKLRLYSAAEQAINAGRLDEAAALYLEAAEVDPSDPEPWLRLGWVQEQRGADQEAREAARHAEEIFNDPFNYELALGQIYIEAGEPEKALPHALRATELNPESPHAFYVLTSAYEGMHNYPEAVEAIRRCEELASAQGDHGLAAMSRVRLGVLLQGGMLPSP